MTTYLLTIMADSASKPELALHKVFMNAQCSIRLKCDTQMGTDGKLGLLSKAK